MKTTLVKEIMVPLADYATVDENATMAEAVLALEQARDRFDKEKLKHRAILVTNSRKQVVGRISYLDFLQGLEPKYNEIEELYHTINRKLGSKYHLVADYSPQQFHSQIQKYNLWEKPLHNLCGKAAACLAKDFMHIPAESDYIKEDASLDQAVHQFVLVRTQSLLVKNTRDITGILRLSDVVETIFNMIKQCQVQEN
ncbi:MAG TPA: CBS domain-containing protein [Desulfotignum sp.]|nr:CBS domain-containing protein [Desulfotignum sp.]